MADALRRPAWQTAELEDEWIEAESESGDDNDEQANGTRSISFTAPLATTIHTINDLESSSSSPQTVGTFLVHQDAPSAPLLPKTPGRNKKANIKDFFTPMPLERMFDPPSPPPETDSLINDSQPSSKSSPSDEILETDLPEMLSFHGRKPSLACQFTFSAPREGWLNPNNSSQPQAESTPAFAAAARAAPASATPLRLFQFQYDTYTREHLSAMVDSIAVNNGSGSNTNDNSPTTFNHTLSRVSEAPSGSVSHLRSAKRVKLSPKSDFEFSQQQLAAVSRPRLFGKDYVGESQSLMQQIKQARDFSTISSVLSARPRSPAGSSEQDDTKQLENDDSPVPIQNTYTSNKYRLEAAALMAQLKNDMHSRKRVFSEDNEPYFTANREASLEQISDPGESEKSRHSVFSNSSSRSRPNPRSSPRQSPRRGRELAPSESELVQQVSRMAIGGRQSPSPSSLHSSALNASAPPPNQLNGFLAPPNSNQPSYPFSSVRSSTNEDLNRFVSSSTASGTTLTSSSVPSFVKHAGPVQIRTIAPSDVPALPDRMGDMMFDKVMMRWVKSSAQVTGTGDYLPTEELSEDPFGDIESLKDDSRIRDENSEILETYPHGDLSRVEEQSEVEDEEEMELTSFETDVRVVEVMTGYDDDLSTSDSAEEIAYVEPQPEETDSEEEEEEGVSERVDETETVDASRYSSAVPTPNRNTSISKTPSSAIRSVLKTPGMTPTSLLKDPNGSHHRTPLRRPKHRRSVSFSDGKRDGPIRGLNKSMDTGEEGQPSVQSKRIADMMAALEDTDSHSDDTDDSPSKTYSSGGKHEEIQPLSQRQPRSSSSSSSRRVFSRSHKSPNANATFLTECSFGVAHDRLVQVITDVEPFEPHWEGLSSIDLSGKNLESVARLKEFLPSLDCLKLNCNQLSWLSGVPGSVRTLSVASNSLTGVTSYHHLLNLENLDISRNQVDSLKQLACLRHLRELKADGNSITSTEGLERMDGLVKLSLQGNCIRSIDLEQHRWSRLEMVNMSENRMDSIIGLASLPCLIALNLDNNMLESLEITGAMPRLKILRASGNRITRLNTTWLPNLRTLYMDNNSLVSLQKMDRLSKLENLSLRNQSGKGCAVLTRDIRDVKRLYFSGNALGDGFLTEACYNLVYLELAACRLTELPVGLNRLMPNVRVINLNYNFLEDASALEGLSRIRKLTIIGSRLKGTKGLIRMLKGMPEVEMLDFRMNPCTLGWYLPLLVRDVPGALQPSESVEKTAAKQRVGWQELDSKFRRDLPDEAYVGRLAYRGLVMKACPRIRLLDGVEVSEKERVKAERLLVGILGRRR
ncbi:Protein nud1 [Stygiomarasmius scandens]|uniref:Protein nud1 n=1 Tax=Marasmiellus scandens TaxID=2682957 RepID=A0ABR1JUX2_9AGAR